MFWPTKFKIACPWRIKTPFMREGVKNYLKRIENYTYIQLIEKKISAHSLRHIKKQEKFFFSLAKEKAYLVALDEKGKRFSSFQLAKTLGRLLETYPEIIFFLGSAEGLPPSIFKKVHLKLSLSPLTLPHEMALLVLVEQLYRVFTILSGEAYHK